MMLSLTWAGFEAAVDVIAAQCTWRDRAGVWGGDMSGQLLAHALSSRLGLQVLREPGPGALLLYGCLSEWPAPAMTWPDADVWAWVNVSRDERVLAVVRALPGTEVLMPWQDAQTNRRPFMPGFDD
jgi:hypothetical protein